MAAVDVIHEQFRHPSSFYHDKQGQPRPAPLPMTPEA